MASYDLTYSYDGAGNRLGMAENFSSAVTTYTYDPANQLLSSEDGEGITSFLYDPDGNRTRKDTPSTLTEYEYDAAGRLALTEPVSGTVTFVYNGRGQRMQKETPTQSQSFLYDFERLLHEYDGDDDSLEHEYTFAPEQYGQLVSEYDEFDDTDTYYTYDAQWSTDALIDEDQLATDRYQYRAFGLQQTHVGSSENPFTFAGKQGYYKDPEIDFYFLGMAGNSTRQGGRFYDPDAGRFVTPDPLGQAAGDINYYRYVKNNPINVIDPSGLTPSGPGKPILSSSFKDKYWFGRSCYQETSLSVKQVNDNFGYQWARCQWHTEFLCRSSGESNLGSYFASSQ